MAVADAEDDDIIEVAEPTSLMIPAGEGAIAIPCLDSLAEALGEYPLAFMASGDGAFFWMGKDLRWQSVERKAGKADIKRVQ